MATLRSCLTELLRTSARLDRSASAERCVQAQAAHVAATRSGASRVLVVGVDDGVPFAPGNECAIHWERSPEGHEQRARERALEQRVAEPCVHRARNDEDDEGVEHLHGRDGECVGCEGQRQRAPQREPGSQQRRHRKRVAEHERQ